MTFSRRIFLRGGVFSAAALASAPFQALAAARILAGNDGPALRKSPAIGIPPSAHASRDAQFAGLSRLSRNSFSSALGTTFQVTPASGTGRPFWLRLLSVNDFASAPISAGTMAVSPPRGQSPSTISFNLAFSGGPAKNVAQGTYIFQHADLGDFAMFIMPAGPQQYSAVINWLQLGKVIPV